jgi:hypothetical protein
MHKHEREGKQDQRNEQRQIIDTRRGRLAARYGPWMFSAIDKRWPRHVKSPSYLL